MFMVLVELALSLVVCGVLAYLLFLSGTMDEELGGAGNGEDELRDAAGESMSQEQSCTGSESDGVLDTSYSPLHRLVHYVLQAKALVQRSTSWSPRRVGAAQETMPRPPRDRSRRGYSRGGGGADASVAQSALYVHGAREAGQNGVAGGFIGSRDTYHVATTTIIAPADTGTAAVMRGSMDRFVLPDGTEVTCAAPASPRAYRNEARSESAHWCAWVTRWLALWFIGGGSVRTAVWQARCERLLAECVRRASGRWAGALRLRDAESRRAFGPDVDGDTLRSTSQVTAGPDERVAGRPLVHLLRLRLGPARVPAGVAASLSHPAPPMHSRESVAWQSQTSAAHRSALLRVRRRLQGGVANMHGTLHQAVGPYGMGSEQAPLFGRDPSTVAIAPASSSTTSSSLPHLTAASFAHVTVRGHAGSDSVSPAVGIALPQLVDDVTSTEVTSSERGLYAKLLPGMHGNNCNGVAKCGAVDLTVSPTLRCFLLPLCYEDGHFMLSLGCALPLAWLLLPARLCIPSDTLALHCTVTIRRVRFHGAVHVAFAGAVLELSFPTAPQFDADVDVTVPTTAPPTRAASATASASSTSCLAEPNAKVQELVRLAIQRAVRSLLYPHVLQARLQWGSTLGAETNSSPTGVNHSPSMSYYTPEVNEAQALWQGWLSWRRTIATLPLYKVYAS